MGASPLSVCGPLPEIHVLEGGHPLSPGRPRSVGICQVVRVALVYEGATRRTAGPGCYCHGNVGLGDRRVRRALHAERLEAADHDNEIVDYNNDGDHNHYAAGGQEEIGPRHTGPS